MLSFRVIEFEYLIQPFADIIYRGAVNKRHRLQRHIEFGAVALKQQIVTGGFAGQIQHIGKPAQPDCFTPSCSPFTCGSCCISFVICRTALSLSEMPCQTFSSKEKVPTFSVCIGFTSHSCLATANLGYLYVSDNDYHFNRLFCGGIRRERGFSLRRAASQRDIRGGLRRVAARRACYPYEFVLYPASPYRTPRWPVSVTAPPCVADLNIHRKYLFLHSVCRKCAFIGILRRGARRGL